MKFRRVLICGATLLVACALGTAAHASADSQNTSNQSSIVKQVNPTYASNNDQAQNNNQSQDQKSNDQPTQQTQAPQYKIRHEQRTNYYTQVNKPRHHRQGYAIYSNPYGTTANSYKPIGHQRQLVNKTLHVIREAIVKNQRWVNFRSKINGWINYKALDKYVRWLNVPLISQRPQLPSGCEVTATAMMLKYRDGHKINKMKLAREMPRSSNPNYGFVGSPYSSSGWWIKPHGLMGLVNHYTHHNALNMDGASPAKIRKQINKNIPVVIWVGAMDGFPNHALTVYGYTKNGFYYNDPWLDRKEYRNTRFLQYKRAVDALIPYGALSYKK